MLTVNEISEYLRKPRKFLHRVYKGSTLVPILGQINSVYTNTICFYKIDSNIFIPFRQVDLSPSYFGVLTVLLFPLKACYMPRPFYRLGFVKVCHLLYKND
jgi:hypothetical protein